MGLELERGLEFFFSPKKTWNKVRLILFLYFLGCSFTSDAQRTFVALQFEGPMTQKSLNSVNEWEKYWKLFDDKYLFIYLHIYPSWGLTSVIRLLVVESCHYIYATP
jgi:hypothetical protein